MLLVETTNISVTHYNNIILYFIYVYIKFIVLISKLWLSSLRTKRRLKYYIVKLSTMAIQRIDSTSSFYSDESGKNTVQNESMDSFHGHGQMPLLLQHKTSNYSKPDPEFKGVTLSWHDLSVYVAVPKQGWGISQRKEPLKRVLNNLAGIVGPGTLMAVMGASGSGKTTLMNAVAKRSPGNVVINGDIRVNGIPIGKFMRKISGYVYQEDLFFSSLTVYEHLNFMARMKLDRRVKRWERKRSVEELLVELGLKKCENTRIERLSGGERKRLAFASEIVSGCPLIFADEVTTGLDSFSALRIIGVMKNLAARGKTILCAIHQPSSQVFTMFDQVCFLAEGRSAYLGPREGTITFFSELGHICPQHFNPADFYIRTLAVCPGNEQASRSNIKFICNAFENSVEYIDMEDEISEELVKYDLFTASMNSMSSNSSESLLDYTLLGSHIRKPLWFTQLYWLTWRSLLEATRDPQIHMIRTVQKIVMALLIGFCFFGVKQDQKGIQDIQGAIFVFITENTFPSMYSVLHVFPHELPLFLRENKNGVYQVDTYYLGKMISLLPGFVIEPLIFVTIAYWMVGLRGTMDAFLLTCLVIVLTANTAAACGCFFSACFDSVSTAITCLIPFDYMLMITGGLFINLSSLPASLSWTKFISWFMYANEAMSVSQWKDVTNITCNSNPGEPCIETGERVLNAASFDQSKLVMDFVALLSLYLSFHIGAFLALLIKSYRK